MLIWKYWPGVQGGTERQCRLMAHALSAMGVDVTVVTHWSGFGVPRREMDGKVQILRIGAVAPLARAVEWLNRPIAGVLRSRARAQLISAEIPTVKAPAFLTPWVCLDLEKWFFLLSARRFFRRNRDRFDVLHVHESHWLAGLGADIGQRLGVPVLVKEASYPVFRPLDVSSPCRRKYDVLRRQAHYLALTPEAAAQLGEQGVAQDGIFTVSNGVEISPLAADPATSQRVLCVANLRSDDYWKRISTLLDAWKEVHARHSAAILTIVGWGDAHPWKEYAERLGVGVSVQFPGESSDIGAWYRQAAVFVLPSKCEGMSNALLEAQSWGLPAVVSDIPGNRAVVQDGVNGILFPVGDDRRLAAAIISLLDSPLQRQTMGRAGRRRLEEDFAIPTVAARLADVYRKLAAGTCISPPS